MKRKKNAPTVENSPLAEWELVATSVTTTTTGTTLRLLPANQGGLRGGIDIGDGTIPALDNLATDGKIGDRFILTLTKVEES